MDVKLEGGWTRRVMSKCMNAKDKMSPRANHSANELISRGKWLSE
jgi:hypothetical protein